MNFENTVALISGANSNVGRSAALALTRSGARVAISGGSLAALEGVQKAAEREGGQVLAVAGDPADSADAERVVNTVLEEYGEIGVLVNAWEFPTSVQLENLGDDDWDRVIDSGVKATFNFTKQVSQAMIQAQKGRIVNITCRELLGREGYTHLSAASSAIASLTRTGAIELGKFQVTVNALALGEIDWSVADGSEPKELTKATPLRRAGTPREVGNAILLLASELAAYITGQTLFVDGGQDLVPSLVLEPSTLAAPGSSS